MKDLALIDPKRVSTGEMLLSVLFQDQKNLNIADKSNKLAEKTKKSLSIKAPLKGAAILGLAALAKEAAVSAMSVFTDMKDTVDDAESSGMTGEQVVKDYDQTNSRSFLDRLFNRKGSADTKDGSADIRKLKLSYESVKEQSQLRGLAHPSEDVDFALRSVALKQGVDYATLYSLAGAESSFRTDVKAGTSSATGLMQFTDSTWSYLVNKEFPELGYALEDRKDAEKSATVAALYVSKINKHLSNQLGYKPSVGEIYAGYFLGPTGAVKFLKAMKENPSAKGAKLFPAAAKANKNLFFSKDGKPLTLQQTYALIDNKITKYHTVASLASPATVASVKPTEVAPSIAEPAVVASRDVVQAPTAKSTPIKQAVIESSVNSVEDTLEVSSVTSQATTTDVSIIPTTTKKRQDYTYTRDSHNRIVTIPS